MKKSDPPVRVEQILNARKEDVWSSITERDQMVKWFFDNIPSFEPVVGFETQFTVATEERIFPHVWKVLDVDVNKRISYSWTYYGYEGDAIVYFELIPKGDKTLLRFTSEVLEDFNDDIPEFKLESCIGGWNYFIRERLMKYIDDTY